MIDTLISNAPCTVHRTFSDDPQRVAVLAEEIIKVFQENHYLACGKHYPGSSDFRMDSHMCEGKNNLSKEYIIEHNLMPYRYLMERGLLPSIMVGHTCCYDIDPDYPASLSKKVIDIIREMGFDGIIFTDSFAMMGILQRFGEEKVYGMAVAAGNDIILPNYRIAVKESYDLLLQNFKDGVFTEERLDEAVRRVLKAMDFISTPPAHPTVFTEEDRALLENVARECITAVVDDGVTHALTDEHEKLFVVMTENGFGGDSVSDEITMAPWYHPEKIAERIKESFEGAAIEFIPEFSSARDHDRVLNRAAKFKEVVIVTFCNTTPYLGTDGLTRRAEAWINALQLSGKISTVVHFGNPFALENLHHIPRKIFGYMIPESQEYAVDVLAGKMQAKGKLPFNVRFA